MGASLNSFLTPLLDPPVKQACRVWDRRHRVLARRSSQRSPPVSSEDQHGVVMVVIMTANATSVWRILQMGMSFANFPAPIFSTRAVWTHGSRKDPALVLSAEIGLHRGVCQQWNNQSDTHVWPFHDGCSLPAQLGELFLRLPIAVGLELSPLLELC